VGHIHIVGGRTHVFILLVGEDINANQVDLQHSGHGNEKENQNAILIEYMNAILVWLP